MTLEREGWFGQMTMNLNQIDLVNNFKEFILGLSPFKESDLRSYFLESENKFKLDIVKSIMDTKKFSLIANEIFIENIYPYLKNNERSRKNFLYHQFLENFQSLGESLNQFA